MKIKVTCEEFTMGGNKYKREDEFDVDDNMGSHLLAKHFYGLKKVVEDILPIETVVVEKKKVAAKKPVKKVVKEEKSIFDKLRINKIKKGKK